MATSLVIFVFLALWFYKMAGSASGNLYDHFGARRATGWLARCSRFGAVLSSRVDPCRDPFAEAAFGRKNWSRLVATCKI
jgi:hypothetical protein